MAIAATLILGSGCSENLEPLTDAELREMWHIEGLIDKTKQLADEYTAELKRLEALEPSYMSERVRFENVEIRSWDFFDDGVSRPCYVGSITNAGQETIDNLDLQVHFRRSNGEELEPWRTSIVTTLGSDVGELGMEPRVTRSLRNRYKNKEPLAPGESRFLHHQNNCLGKPPRGWSPESINHEFSGLKLRPTLEKYTITDVTRLRGDLAPLRARAEANGQLKY